MRLVVKPFPTPHPLDLGKLSEKLQARADQALLEKWRRGVAERECARMEKQLKTADHNV